MHYLRRNVQWAALHRNVERRVIDGVTISATHMLSGRLAMFLEKHPDVEYHSGGHFPIACLWCWVAHHRGMLAAARGHRQ